MIFDFLITKCLCSDYAECPHVPSSLSIPSLLGVILGLHVIRVVCYNVDLIFKTLASLCGHLFM